MAGATSRDWIITPRSDGTVWMEDVVPVLSNQAVANVTATSGTLSVTTTVPTGTLYVVVTESTTKPSVSHVKAGTDHNGNAPLFETSVLVSAAGVRQVPLVGLSGIPAKYAYVVHSANGFDSGVAVAQFALDIASPYPAYDASTSGVAPAGWFNMRDSNADFAAVPLAVGATIQQTGPLVPANVGTLELDDQWLARAVFVEFGNDQPVQPEPINTLVTNNINASSGTVPVSTLSGIAADQFLTMVIISRNILTTNPGSQGWTVRGTPIEVGTSGLNAYVYSKIAVANEASISLVHAGGRMLVFTTNWINVDTTTPFDVLPTFAQSNDTDPVRTTPSITTTNANATVVSLYGHANNPTLTAQPSTYSLLQAAYGVSGVYFLGAAYKKLTAIATTGALTWSINEPGGFRTVCTFALKGSATGILKYPFTVPLRHSVGGVNTDFNWTVDPYG